MLEIGACVRHAAFHKPVVDDRSAHCSPQVVRHIAHYPIRMRGTFCGSLAHADPASEWCLVAATLDAEMVAKSMRGERVIAAKDFFQGIMSTALAEDELLAEVRLPLLARRRQVRLLRIQPPRRRFRHGARRSSPTGSQAARSPRLASASAAPKRAAADRRGRSRAQRPARRATQRSAPRPRPPPRRSIRWRIIQTNAEYRRDLVRAVVRRALEHVRTHDRADQRLRH